VRQQNSGAVEDFTLPHSAVYLRTQKWKNYWIRPTFANAIVKIKVAPFYGPRCSKVKFEHGVCAIRLYGEKKPLDGLRPSIEMFLEIWR